MYQIKFAAENINVSKNEEDQYYMIAIADHKTDYDNYIIFQKTFNPDELEEESELSGIYIECNGESCYNCCDKIILKNDVLKFEVKGTSFEISLKKINLDDQFNFFMVKVFEDKFIKSDE